MSILKKLTSILLHRSVQVALLLLLQIALLVAAVVKFSDYFIYIYFLCVVLSLLEVLYILNKPDDPGYKLTWITMILLAPVFGGLVYLVCGGNGLTRRVRRKMEGMSRHLRETLEGDRKADRLAGFGQDAVNQSRYIEEHGFCPLYTNTATQYYPLGDKVMEPLLEALRGAEKYIFLEFYIIAPGRFWDSVLEILTEKARQGVDVRVIYDDVGSIYTLPKDYEKTLEANGIQCRVFNPFIPVLSVRLNNRDHRKICVVDGHTAFTGGFNLADEYINEKERFGHWKDSAIRLKGEGAWPMTVMFLTMWEYVSGVRERFETYRPKILPPEARQAEGWVQPYTDSPLVREPVAETVYLNLINKAKEYIYITTPYLVINDALNTALRAAAQSGVEVWILTPHVPDKKAVFEMTRAHYIPLLEAGVRIFEYTPGFLHAKTFVVDDRYATVGSINLDYRSMFLSFENGVWLCGDPAVLDVKDDILNTRQKCEEITLEKAKDHNFFRLLFRAVVRVFAPLM